MKFKRKMPGAGSIAVVAIAALVASCGGGDGGHPGFGFGAGIAPAPVPVPNPAPVANDPPVTAQRACTLLAGTKAAGATVLAAVEVPADGDVPLYCKVTARIDPALNLEMRIPNEWNGKLQYTGGGGFDGSIPPLNVLSLGALKQGYVTVSSDSGHQAPDSDASWAIGNPQAEALFGYLSVPTVMASALAMVKTAYGKAPTRSYFEGCSNGGREGLIAAQRNPALFDGVAARAPALNFVGAMGAFNRNVKAVLAPGGMFTPAKVALLSNAVLAACDAKDGVADGIVSNPSACSFDAKALRCSGGADTGDSCLSDAQLAVVDSWTTPATFAGGAYRNPGWALSGNESTPGAGWDAWLLGRMTAQFILQDSGIKSFIARDLTIDTLTYPFESNLAALAHMSATLDATNPDLQAFRQRGGKLMLWHGGADPALSARTTTQYYKDAVAAAGGQAEADAFTRFYISPGVAHCMGGPGADTSDLLTSLDQWVEKGVAPQVLASAKLAADGSTSLSRPLCPYPQYPRYTGSAGDAVAATVAANFSCTSP
ncbi:tannase/feruloyl esterase family alpha/beta hydrolase [Variovorax sp. IB41]|uniref:tannase/feruloyl esterase family alpha/beta hydrolase n=1 Tax=Variovorax sp. IB41 TaxID=2779370 RepID=UPI0018E84D48|nr:tannase/feruloyl esterase family alpha/beta hydrolase [Variovorax sp. IB41]MBJ2155205.1 tannase/feruloyl esterase family alpha/beta hydrolase [Variovorax sp. IB41]